MPLGKQRSSVSIISRIIADWLLLSEEDIKGILELVDCLACKIWSNQNTEENASRTQRRMQLWVPAKFNFSDKFEKCWGFPNPCDQIKVTTPIFMTKWSIHTKLVRLMDSPFQHHPVHQAPSWRHPFVFGGSSAGTSSTISSVSLGERYWISNYTVQIRYSKI